MALRTNYTSQFSKTSTNLMLCVYSHKLVLYLHALHLKSQPLILALVNRLSCLCHLYSAWPHNGCCLDGTSASYLKSTSTERLAEWFAVSFWCTLLSNTVICLLFLFWKWCINRLIHKALAEQRALLTLTIPLLLEHFMREDWCIKH